MAYTPIPTGSGSGASVSNAAPTNIGTTASGSSADASRDDHVHAMATKVVVAEATAELANEVNLGALTTGILKHTVAGAVSTPATAVAGTDYLHPAGVAGGQAYVGGTGAGEDNEISSTGHATKGHTRIGGSGGLIWDESVARGAVGGAIDSNWLWTIRQINSSGLRIQGPSTDGRAHQRMVDSADARNMDFFQYGSATAGDFVTGVANAGLCGVYSEGGSGMIIGTGNNASLRLIANNVIRIHANGTGLAVFGATPAAQGATVADAAGGAVIDAEARTALNALLARIRTFGIIAT